MAINKKHKRVIIWEFRMKKIIIQLNGIDNLLLKHILYEAAESKFHLSFKRELMEFQE